MLSARRTWRARGLPGVTPLLIFTTLIAIDDKDTHCLAVTLHFLYSSTRPLTFFLLVSVDANVTINPSFFLNAIDQLLRFRIPPARDTKQEPPLSVSLLNRLQVGLTDHAAIASKYHSSKIKTFRQIVNDMLDRRAVARIAGPDVMRDRPTSDHHDADDHLHVARLPVAAVTMLRNPRTMTFEVRARQVVQNQVRAEIEQVTQAMIKRNFKILLVQQQVIQSAIPAL